MQAVKSLRIRETGLERAIKAIVLDALQHPIGGKLATSEDLQRSTGTGAGTIQRAFDYLSERQALQTTSRGHMGRRIDDLDLGLAWQAANLDAIRFLLSSDGPLEQRVLEEDLATELSELGIPYTFSHVSGGNGRLEAVSKREFDIAIVSAGTLDGVRNELHFSGLGHTRVFPPGTYYAPERLITLTGPAARDPNRHSWVGIDTKSFDHAALTNAEFPESDLYTHVDMHFTEIPAKVLAGIIARGIWHLTASPFPPFLTGLEITQLEGEETMKVVEQLSGAAAVARSDRPELAAALDALELDDLLSHQSERIAEEEEWFASLREQANLV